MKAKKNMKWMIDLVMTIFFILVMGYQQTGLEVHEYIGTILFVLFLIHNILNINWYKSLFKAKITKQKAIFMIVNFLLLLTFIGSMISGIMMSNYIYAFLNLDAGMFARRLHMISTSWCFILMSIHLGLHWIIFYNLIKNKLKDKPVAEFMGIFLPILAYALVLFGVWVFIDKEMWNEMFLLVDFVFLDFQESFFLFFIKQLCLMSVFVWVGNRIRKIK